MTFANRLKSIRMQRGFTQQALGDALGVSKSIISQYEKGKKKPGSATLVALARVFGVHTEYFFSEPKIQLEQVEFRKAYSLTNPKIRGIKAQVADHLEKYLELEGFVGAAVPFTNPIQGIPIYNIEDAEAAAEAVLNAWDLGTNPIPNILELLEEKGIKVVLVEEDSKFSGMSTYVGDTPVVVLNRTMDIVRLRFTALHELGHLLLDLKMEEKKAQEKACHRFAGAMLIPDLRTQLGGKRMRIALSELIMLKEYYGASIASIMYRAGDQGIVSRELLDRFWKRRRQSQELSNEKEGYGDYQGEERATRFNQLLAQALAEEHITFSKAAYLSGKSISELKDTQFIV